LSDVARESLIDEYIKRSISKNKTCNTCKQTFYHSKQLANHLCDTQEQAIQIARSNTKEALLIQENALLKERIAALESIIQNALTCRQKRDRPKVEVETHNACDNEESQTNDIIVNSFRYENVAYMEDDIVTNLLKIRSRENACDNIVKYIKQIYLNPEHPENNTVYIPRADISCVKIQGTGWTIQNVNKTIQSILNASVSFLVDIIDNREDDFNQGTLELWEHVYEIIDEPGDFSRKMHGLVCDEFVLFHKNMAPAINEIRKCGKEVRKMLKL